MAHTQTQLEKFTLYLLGAPRLERENEILQVDTRKAIAMLAYLALTGQPQSRDTLAALLWPDNSQSNARAALRRTISALHRSMGKPFLETQQDLLALPESGGLQVDIWELRRCLEECKTHGHPASQVCPDCFPWLVKAADLYGDSFMAGFTLRDSAEFDDWQFFQSEALRRELAGVLERLVNGYAAQGEFNAAIGYAQRWLSLDTLHEPAHRQLMLLYAISGQRTAALRQYQECVHILEEELDVAPLEETRRLFEDIKSSREIQALAPWIDIFIETSLQPSGLQAQPTRAESQDRALSGQTLTSLPLIGRDSEWAKLQQIYSTIRQDGRLAVLEGEAGIGKTRLANDFIAQTHLAGAGTISATCYPGESNLALAPFVEGLSHAIDQPARGDWQESISPAWLGEAARLLPVLSRLRPDLPQTPYSESPGAQTRFFEGLRQVIRAVCGTQPPGVLFLDDIQWADETSLDLLGYLVRRLPANPLLVLITWRGEDLDVGHRLRRMLAEAQRSSYGEIIRLSRLKPESIEKLVIAASPAKGSIIPALGQKIYNESEGLPFFIVEYLASVTAGEPADNLADRQMPHGVRDLLHSRLEQIGETGWQLLQAAAVIGRSFDFVTLRDTSGRTDEETITTLEGLIKRGLIAEVQSGNDEAPPDSLRVLRYDFSHDKLRELVHSETSQARKRLLHTRCAEALVGLARRQRDWPLPAGQIAHHFRQGGKAREAAEFYKLAGEQARALYANIEALNHFQSALALGHPAVAAIDEAIGDMHTLSGNYGASIQSYQAALAQQMDSPAGTARLDHKLGEVHHRLGEWEQAERYFQACAETLETSSETGGLSRLYADWSRTAYQHGDSKRACQMAQRALDLAEQANDPPALAQALNVLGILARRHGDLQEAIHYLERSLTLAVEMAEPTVHIAALNNLSLAYADQGTRSRAIECTLQALDLCTLLGDRHHEAALITPPVKKRRRWIISRKPW
jgi:DNA-binding SARP family transcriptional activator